METLPCFSLDQQSIADEIPALILELYRFGDEFGSTTQAGRGRRDAGNVLPQERFFHILKLLEIACAELDLDFLTKLPLRGPFSRALARALLDSRRERDPYSVACMIIDCDNLHYHNKLGHHIAGDALIRAVANAIRAHIAEINMVARIGGDEFAVFIPRVSLREAETIAERIRMHVANTAGLVADGSCSIGISMSSEKIRTVDTLIKSADAVTFTAKSKGGNFVAVCS